MFKIGRAPRNEFAGACYHIMHRGNNRENIFETAQDKNVFTGALRVLLQKYDCMLLAYVIMSNHYHLLLRRLNDPVNKFMHQLDVRYAQYYTRERRRSGHVLECRYKAYLVLDDDYLLSVLRYIHQNPVQAQIVKWVNDYFWSSDVYYRKGKPGFVDPDFILDVLSDNRQKAVDKYIKLMDLPLKEEEKKGLFPNINQRTEMETLNQTTQLQQAEFDITLESQQQPSTNFQNEIQAYDHIDLDAILIQCCSGEAEFKSIKAGCRSRLLTSIKAAYARQARDAGYTLQEIGDNISLSDAGVWSLLNN